MITLNDYREDLIENIQLDYNSKSIPQTTAFFERTTDILSLVGDLDTSVYNGFNAEFAFYGFAIRQDSGTLQLITILYSGEEYRNLLKTEIEGNFKKIERLIPFINKKKYKQAEETSEFYDCCSEIYDNFFKEQIKEIQCILITDQTLPKSLYHIENKLVDGIQHSYAIYDIDYFYQIFKNGNQYSNFEIKTNLPCLIVNENNSDYVSYLTVMPGKELAKIYGDFKSKLLEENVRTFLQFRGDVNKGIRYTLQEKPNFFFAYNNGITATATEVEIINGSIKCIKNLQIVNGGQTTASIYTASEKFNIDLSNVNVPMKLSVVKKLDLHSTFVANVAEFANTQNKVNKSDFFSNSKYHIDMKKTSGRIWVSRKIGSQVSSRWYYERVRGEYLNEQSSKNKNDLNKFLLEYPKIQYIDKIDLAKTENAWLLRPYYSSLGAQGSFVKFSEYITSEIENNENLVTESYFKAIISRLIIYREIEKLISSSSWYTGGFRAQSVAYSMSAFSLIANSTKSIHFDFEKIWELQAIPDDLKGLFEEICKRVHITLVSPNSRYGNVSVYAKKKDCWDSISKINFQDIKIKEFYLIESEDYKKRIKETSKDKSFDEGLDKEILIYKTSHNTWKKLLQFYSGDRMSDFALKTLKKYSTANTNLPTLNETKILFKLLVDAKRSGFDD